MDLMGAPYHQFCPVAKAMELLDERWTLLVIRELIAGSQHFNELRRGLPKMSPTLLSRRLQQLAAAGIVERRPVGAEVHYFLTQAGRELEPVVIGLGTWGIRWIGELGDQDLDPKLLLWDMHRHVDLSAIPPGRTAMHFRFPEVTPQLRRWWLILTPEAADVCDDDPGHEVAVTVETSLRCLTEIWIGRQSWQRAQKAGDLTIDGPAELRRAVPSWFKASPFANVPRPEAAAIR